MNVLVTLAQIEEAEDHLPTAEALLREGIEIVTGTRGYDSAAQLNPFDALVQLLRRTGFFPAHWRHHADVENRENREAIR